LNAGRPVRAVFFDLDGTLVDRETQTDEAVGAVVARHGIADFSLPHADTRGRTWAHVAETIRTRTGLAIPAKALAAELLEYWNDATAQVRPVPGSPEALRAAAESGLTLGVVSSSPRAVIDAFLDQLGVGDCIDRRARIGGDGVRRGKPDPEGFLLAARRVGVEPADALVFEDSEAGLLAARAAGMRSMFISCCASDIERLRSLATASCTDYRALPPGFWDALAGGGDFAGRSYP
jgi:HAD superfamily hydrolase (TIGR01509 family)